MNAIQNFLDVVEYSDPGLYDVLDGDEVRRELALLEKDQGRDSSVLMVIKGEEQRIVNVEKIGARRVRGGWLLEVPVVIVESRRTAPPKQSLTKA
jgi:hypothetical protein